MMEAKEIYYNETGQKCCHAGSEFDQWDDQYVEWLEGKVENLVEKSSDIQLVIESRFGKCKCGHEYADSHEYYWHGLNCKHDSL